MSRRNLIVALVLIAAVVAVFFYLRPCGPSVGQQVSEPLQGKPAIAEPPKKDAQPAADKVKAEPVMPKDTSAPVEKNVPPAKHEVDTAPPVQLSSTEEIPDIGRCAVKNFPPEARPHVTLAIVTVKLVVDKFGNVISDTPISVEFPQGLDDDILPQMRKLFIKAGSRAFGAKKCPPYKKDGQNLGYEIEVPIHYKP